MGTRSLVTLAATLGLAGMAGFTQAAERPQLEVGESWTVRRANAQSNEVVEVATREVTAKTSDGYEVLYTGDKVRVPNGKVSKNLGRVAEVNGKRAEVGALDFPLVPGKTWQVREEYVNDFGNTGYNEATYKVEGPEDVTVEAGTFKAIKVTSSGNWYTYRTNNSGGFETVMWYAPEAKAVVRQRRTTYYRGGPAETIVSDLVKYQLKP
jgi:hypothetical protein